VLLAAETGTVAKVETCVSQGVDSDITAYEVIGEALHVRDQTCFVTVRNVLRLFWDSPAECLTSVA